MRSLPPRLTARAWDFASASQLLSRTAADCGAADNSPRGARFQFTLPTATVAAHL